VGEPPVDAGNPSLTTRQPGGQDKCPFCEGRRVGSAELFGRRQPKGLRSALYLCFWDFGHDVSEGRRC